MISAANIPDTALKSHSREWLFCIALLLCLAGCGQDKVPVQLAGASMGTTWHVSYVPSGTSPAEQELLAGIQGVLEDVEQSMSTYRPDSEISRFNALPPDAWFEVSTGFYTVLSSALMVGRQSEGAYDITVGPLVDLWGFGPGPSIQAPPPPSAVAETLARVGQDKLRLDGDRRGISKLAPLSLDFSSIAKGYAVDRVASWLLEMGVGRFLVEVGGEMRMAGLSHRGDSWHIAIEQPDSAGRSVAAGISVTDMAVATSGDYRNYFEMDGRRYSHSIDPRSGHPVAHDLVSVTVIHPSAMLADAWATALTVLGGERAMVVAQAQDLAVYFIRREGDAYAISHTAAFTPWLQAQNQKEPGGSGE